MRATSLGEIVLDRADQERLSKLLEWAAQLVVSIEHVTVQEVAQFVQGWDAVQVIKNPGLRITNYKLDRPA